MAEGAEVRASSKRRGLIGRPVRGEGVGGAGVPVLAGLLQSEGVRFRSSALLRRRAAWSHGVEIVHVVNWS